MFIRNVSEEQRDNERFSALFDGIEPDAWVLFDDPQALALPEAP